MKVEEIDLSSVDFWRRPRPTATAAFATLRRERPIVWQDAPRRS